MWKLKIISIYKILKFQIIETSPLTKKHLINVSVWNTLVFCKFDPPAPIFLHPQWFTKKKNHLKWQTNKKKSPIGVVALYIKRRSKLYNDFLKPDILGFNNSISILYCFLSNSDWRIILRQFYATLTKWTSSIRGWFPGDSTEFYFY